MCNLYSITKDQQAIRQLSTAPELHHALTIVTRGERKDEAGKIAA